MTYEVLARKWRPLGFAQMAGQEHVLQALVNALEAGRLHHAYLFTGTRGVGKTTVARIFARCLNCEQGVSAYPCGECSSCREIAEGRFVDLIEVDAASRTRVEDTRELLDNVQYAPTRGRFKVYLIDEVHMLSQHSFNALLKTLEEPPPHVKFLLATTDPRKLPVTVLSRCLQFHMKNLTPEAIARYLGQVLDEEGVDYDAGALTTLARSADGSMRDALSLADQAVAFCQGRLAADAVARLLGTVDQSALEQILQALASGDGRALLSCAETLAEHAADFAAVLNDLLSALHAIAVAQAVPEAASDSRDRHAALVVAMADRLAPEDIQLYYQMGVLGQRDLPWAPDARVGFEMTLLRMLAFQPDAGPGDEPPTRAAAGAAPAPARSSAATAGSGVGGDKAVSTRAAAATSAGADAMLPGARDAAPGAIALAAPPAADADWMAAAPANEPPHAAGATRDEAFPEHADRGCGSLDATQAAPAWPRPALDADPVEGTTRGEANASAKAVEASEPPAVTATDWHALLPRLALTGLTLALAEHCVLESIDGDVWRLHLEPEGEALLADVHTRRIEAALVHECGHELQVRISVASVATETPARRRKREADERQQQAVAAIEQDEVVRMFQQRFNASLQRDSIRPLG